MIFFRSQTVGFRFQKGDKTLLLFGKLKAFYEAPVDELSGMTVNLKDVDLWMKQALLSAPILSSSTEALQFYFNSLKKHSSAFQKIEIKIGAISSSFDGKMILKTYRLRSWFQENKTWVQRPITIQSQKSLSKKWRNQLARKKWSSPDALASKLQSLLTGLSAIEIHSPEQSLTRRFSFQKN